MSVGHVDRSGNGEIDIPELGGACKVVKGIIHDSSGKPAGYYGGQSGIGYSGRTILQGVFRVPDDGFSVGYSGFSGAPLATMSYRKYNRNLPKFLRKKG